MVVFPVKTMDAHSALALEGAKMPVYEYACQQCGHQLEANQRMSEDPLTKCPKCEENALERLVSQSSFALKGSGWYADGYGSSGSSDKSSSDTKSETKAESSGSDSKSEKSDKSAPKATTESAGKSDTKSDT